LEKILLNGELVNRKIAIDIEDRGYQFGDGVYEVIGVYNNIAFKLEEHLERLFESAEKINMDIELTIKQLKEKVLKLKKENLLKDGLIYVQVTRGITRRNHAYLDNKIKPNLIAYVLHQNRLPSEVYQNGVPVILTKDIRWLRCDIKSLNLLPNVLAKQNAIEKGAFEAILYRNDNITITEGSSTNVFVIKDKTIYTHPANNYILNGITRQIILDICIKLNLKVQEIEFSKSFLLNADEVFISGTYIDIVPVSRVLGEDVEFTNQKSITFKLMKELNKLTMSI